MINERPQLAADIIDILSMQTIEQAMERQYLVYNFSSIREWEAILTSIGIQFETIIAKSWLSKRPLDFFSVLANSTIQYPGRLVFLCDSFSDISNNRLWLKYRGSKGDMYMDTAGNIGLLTELYEKDAEVGKTY